MSDPKLVDPNTDNLDDFTELFTGKAKEQTEVKEDNDVEDDTLATEDETPEEDETEGEDEENEGDEPEDSDEEPEPAPKPKKKATFQDRIDELVAARKDAERLREADKAEYERKLADLAAKIEAKPAPTPETAPTEKEGPKPDAVNAAGEAIYPLGEFDPTFIRDLTRFTINQETERAKAEAKQAAEQTKIDEARTALSSEWTGKLEKARETYPDIQDGNQALETTFSSINPQYGEYLATTIMSMEKGVDVLAYLGKNIEVAKQIVASGPAAATLALGRLEARFMQADEPTPTKKVSQASPPPVARSRGTGSGNKVAADTDDLDAFEKLYFNK